VRIALFVTCVVDVVAPEVGAAAVRVLRAAGHEVEVPPTQTCCGQPAWNSGFAEEAAKVGGTTLEALAGALDGGADRVVGLAGSCSAMARVFWPEVFELVGDHEASARAKAVGERFDELSEFLAREGLPPVARATCCGSCGSRSSPSRCSTRSAANGCRGRRPSAAAGSAACSR
jgi:L-lactate dehydrogenase complex protein LldE